MRLRKCERKKLKMRRKEEASLKQIHHLKFDDLHRKQLRADGKSGQEKKKVRGKVFDDAASSGQIVCDCRRV